MMQQELGDPLHRVSGVNDVEENGYTPLHHAVIRNDSNLIEQLLIQGADIDATDNTDSTALHIAVLHCLPKCVEVLLHYHCDVNLQDFEGDTALHKAMKLQNNTDVIINLLCNCGRVDFKLWNHHGCNIPHLATFVGKAHAVNRLVTGAPYLVDMKTTLTKFTAFHIAVAEGHQEIAAILLSKPGRAKVDLCIDNTKEKPLHLATVNQNWSLVELLVHHNADISKVDRYGDTVLHNAICSSLGGPITLTPERCRDSPFIHAIWQNLKRQGETTELALACFLVSVDKSGQLLEHARNNLNQTPLDVMKSLIGSAEFSRPAFYDPILMSFIVSQVK